MSKERYIKVAEYVPSQSIPDSPVEILRGALLRDRKNDSIVLQLKLFNNSSVNINSAYLAVECYDDTGEHLTKEGPVLHSYLDLYATPKKSFGEQSAIPLPDASTRKVEVTLLKAKLANDEVVDISSLERVDIPKAPPINSLGDDLLHEFDTPHG